MQVWPDCINTKKLKEVNEWCHAWRRIMLNSSVGTVSNLENDKPKQFNRDSQILMSWLAKKLLTRKYKKIQTNYKHITDRVYSDELLLPELLKDEESSFLKKTLLGIFNIFSETHIHDGLRRR